VLVVLVGPVEEGREDLGDVGLRLGGIERRGRLLGGCGTGVAAVTVAVVAPAGRRDAEDGSEEDGER
jgi:hypothetical protein